MFIFLCSAWYALDVCNSHKNTVGRVGYLPFLQNCDLTLRCSIILQWIYFKRSKFIIHYFSLLVSLEYVFFWKYLKRPSQRTWNKGDFARCKHFKVFFCRWRSSKFYLSCAPRSIFLLQIMSHCLRTIEKMQQALSFKKATSILYMLLVGYFYWSNLLLQKP